MELGEIYRVIPLKTLPLLVLNKFRGVLQTLPLLDFETYLIFFKLPNLGNAGQVPHTNRPPRGSIKMWRYLSANLFAE